MRIACWVITAAALAIASLGLAIPSDVEDSWCAPQTGSAVPGTSGETASTFGAGLLAVVGGAVGVGRRLLRRTG